MYVGLIESSTQIMNTRRLRSFKTVVKVDKNKTFQFMEVVGNAVFNKHTYVNTSRTQGPSSPTEWKIPTVWEVGFSPQGLPSPSSAKGPSVLSRF